MQILHTDSVFRVPPNTTPDYEHDNALLRLMTLIEGQRLAAEREAYAVRQMQYLFPIRSLELFGPSAPDSDLLDPTQQDNKVDFQKQNIRSFTLSETRLVRGLARAGDWSGPFLRISYPGGPLSPLAIAAHGTLGPTIALFIKVGAVAVPALVPVPYNPASGQYEIEIWSYPGADLGSKLGPKGKAALARGELVAMPGLVQGQSDSFSRDRVDGRLVSQVAPGHALHPILPLRIELSWATPDGSVYDSNGGKNYVYQFQMVLRGWNNFLSVGTSPNPHGGIGFLEYRNLLSNYGKFTDTGELGRDVMPWSFGAFGQKPPSQQHERFMTVDYMDLHVVRPNAGIGLHRHRDNQEAFLLLQGQALMIVGDWCQFDSRERCLEVRSLEAGHLALLKGGNLHGLINPTDAPISLFMFGGYD